MKIFSLGIILLVLAVFCSLTVARDDSLKNENRKTSNVMVAGSKNPTKPTPVSKGPQKTEKTEKPKTKKTEKPKTEKTEKPKTKKTEKPKTEKPKIIF
ncbi:unnamed protein product [Brachionus calyciflorus]|uniref:Uncharacterized protein n=1 Tax=Brachionus calyciflorus TaxID=104777 RepID=A0A814FME4_9BILA|nr:unnamed protein product [Brachionus calyciflorus]